MTYSKPARDNLQNAIRLVISALDGIDLPAIKARDRREPDRREKEAAEDVLILFLRRYWRKQEQRLRERLQFVKAALPDVDDIFEPDDEDMAALARLLTRNVRGGIALFGASTAIDIDYSLTNLQAAEWARKYAGTLIKNIDKTTLEVVRGALNLFVETPGFTIGDLVGMLPYGEQRALNIAVTEITRTYAQGQQMAGEELKEQFPDVRIVKRWFTNNDERVCELCGPLDGVEVELDEPFYEPENEYQDGNPPRHVGCRCFEETSTALAE
jgi:hypothetical protein